ncbi:MAG: hypothetical protein LQ350_008314 [Teloschistes chrysophthalmus]|nr:MAG: hypothetical protein LQ350_008314 [Niorma chrysophthalma]
MPYSAIQATFEDEADVFIGNAIATFATLAGGAIGISVGEAALVSKLVNEVPKHTHSVTAESVISSGALILDKLTSSAPVLDGLHQAYGSAISTVMIYATVAICVSVLTTLGMPRFNLKSVSADKEHREGDVAGLSSHQDVAELGMDGEVKAMY